VVFFSKEGLGNKKHKNGTIKLYFLQNTIIFIVAYFAPFGILVFQSIVQLNSAKSFNVTKSCHSAEGRARLAERQ